VGQHYSIQDFQDRLFRQIILSDLMTDRPRMDIQCESSLWKSLVPYLLAIITISERVSLKVMEIVRPKLGIEVIPVIYK
jgi:hypothetical protein